ncbi:aminoacyl-tRNA deacylase [Dethiobacter alkaliphilus]|uniref:YbaK/prolyl-tRNA synthetase associated region n=1 Tax=Dethiobacter alkaliphilus AHT 1 TaxID=555088 RepID=C0GDQ3_DETAL|nr:YbaK/EbsC family protein [Dethiobacter alkaliphilus]EEG78536.1 YbaK/prolyl-tRNA synthetase associated region [Dethiobacter alkaliphilus AHT 1]
MSELEKKIKDFMSTNNISAEHLSFNESCHSVAEAAEAAGASTEEFVKNICLLGPDGELAVAIVRGNDRVDTKKAARYLGLKKMRMANAEEILQRTGYPCGGTPSFGFEATFLIDKNVMDMPVLYSGGGSQTSLIKSTPQALLAANEGSVTDLVKS